MLNSCQVHHSLWKFLTISKRILSSFTLQALTLSKEKNSLVLKAHAKLSAKINIIRGKVYQNWSTPDNGLIMLGNWTCLSRENEFEWLRLWYYNRDLLIPWSVKIEFSWIHINNFNNWSMKIESEQCVSRVTRIGICDISMLHVFLNLWMSVGSFSNFMFRIIINHMKWSGFIYKTISYSWYISGRIQPLVYMCLSFY